MQQQQPPDPPTPRVSPFLLAQTADGESLDSLAACLLQALKDCHAQPGSGVSVDAGLHQLCSQHVLAAAAAGRVAQHHVAGQQLAAACGHSLQPRAQQLLQLQAPSINTRGQQHQQELKVQGLQCHASSVPPAAPAEPEQTDPGYDVDIEDGPGCSSTDPDSDPGLTSLPVLDSVGGSGRDHAEVRAILEGCLVEAAEIARTGSITTSDGNSLRTFSSLWSSLNTDSSFCTASSTSAAFSTSVGGEINIDWQVLLLEELQGTGVDVESLQQSSMQEECSTSLAGRARTASEAEVQSLVRRGDSAGQRRFSHTAAEVI